MPERLNLAAHRAGVLTVVLTGPGSPDRLASLAARLRGELPSPERGEGRALTAARVEVGHGGGDASPNDDARRPAVVDGGHRPVGLATDRPTDIATARPPQPPRTVVTLNDIRLGAPPPDAALVVVLPRFAPHSVLDHAADLGVTADWPILGVIGIRRRSWLASLDRLGPRRIAGRADRTTCGLVGRGDADEGPGYARPGDRDQLEGSGRHSRGGGK